MSSVLVETVLVKGPFPARAVAISAMKGTRVCNNMLKSKKKDGDAKRRRRGLKIVNVLMMSRVSNVRHALVYILF